MSQFNITRNLNKKAETNSNRAAESELKTENSGIAKTLDYRKNHKHNSLSENNKHAG